MVHGAESDRGFDGPAIGSSRFELGGGTPKWWPPRVAVVPATEDPSERYNAQSGGAMGAFVIDFTERFRRISEGIGILELSSGDEISVQIPAEAKIISALALSVLRFDAFDLLCDFVLRCRQESHPDVEKFRMAALRVAGFDPDKL